MHGILKTSGLACSSGQQSIKLSKVSEVRHQPTSPSAGLINSFCHIEVIIIFIRKKQHVSKPEEEVIKKINSEETNKNYISQINSVQNVNEKQMVYFERDNIY